MSAMHTQKSRALDQYEQLCSDYKVKKISLYRFLKSCNSLFKKNNYCFSLNPMVWDNKIEEINQEYFGYYHLRTFAVHFIFWHNVYTQREVPLLLRFTSLFIGSRCLSYDFVRHVFENYQAQNIRTEWTNPKTVYLIYIAIPCIKTIFSSINIIGAFHKIYEIYRR